MRKVRTTMQPWKELEIDDAEYLDLSRQGLLVEESGSDAASTEQENTE